MVLLKEILGIPATGINEFLRKVDLLKYAVTSAGLSIYGQDITGVAMYNSISKSWPSKFGASGPQLFFVKSHH